MTSSSAAGSFTRTWSANWIGSGPPRTSAWRTLSQERAEAANAIVSDIIDRFFADDEPPVFQDIAKELGFELLNQGGDMGLDPRR